MTAMTTIDCPGRLAAVLYCQGCSWRCDYCHNPELLDGNVPPSISWDKAMEFLLSRKGLLDGVVFSGGEPLVQKAIYEAISEVKDKVGMEVGLHTSGAIPERFKAILPLLDWVGLDIKAMPDRYDEISHAHHSGEKAFECLDLLLNSNVEYECRTTWNTSLYPVEELIELANLLKSKGVKNWALQECRTPEAPIWSLTSDEVKLISNGFDQFTLRRP